MTLRLLAVHAHPDDESSKGAGTYAAYEDRGAEVMVVSCTGGEAGDVLNEALAARAHAERDLPGLRRLEMDAAQEVLGIEHRWLGYRDSGMARADGSFPVNSFASIPLEISVLPLIRLVREFRPHVLITYDELGGYPHPDHIRSHELAMLAWKRSGADEHPELGAPWTVQKLYYDRTMNGDRYERLLDGLRAEPQYTHLAERLGALLERIRDRHSERMTHIEIAKYLGMRDRALRAHESQVAPDDEFFFGFPREIEAVAYPYDDYELVAARIEVPAEEHDLFDGVIDEGHES